MQPLPTPSPSAGLTSSVLPAASIGQYDVFAFTFQSKLRPPPPPRGPEAGHTGCSRSQVRRPRVGPALLPSQPEHRRPLVPPESPHPASDKPRASPHFTSGILQQGSGSGAVQAGAGPQDPHPATAWGSDRSAEWLAADGAQLNMAGGRSARAGRQLRFPGTPRTPGTRVCLQVSVCRVGVLPGAPPLPSTYPCPQGRSPGFGHLPLAAQATP